jgi:arylsulfatase A-like enzyme
MPITGTSPATPSTPDAPSRKTVQYFEMGPRGLCRDGWKAVTATRPGRPMTKSLGLYHVENDSECHDLAAVKPEKVAELVAVVGRG